VAYPLGFSNMVQI